MIVVENVLLDARELRPCPSVWKPTAGLAWVQTLVLLFVFVATFITAALQQREETATWIGVTMIVVLVALMVSGSFVNAGNARAVAAAAKAQGAGTWTFDRDGFRVDAAFSQVVIKWDIVTQVFEEKDRLIFVLGPYSNPVFPRRLLTDDQAAALRDLIAQVTAEGRLGRGVD